MSDDFMTLDDELAWNGINGSTGEALFRDSAPELMRRVRGMPWHDAPWYRPHLEDLRRWFKRLTQDHLDTVFDADPRKLEEAGWGVVWPPDVRPEVREALRPLLDRRRAQAGAASERRFRELDYRPDDSKLRFLGRHGAGPGPVDPDRLPYYLLLAGGPEEIPYPFQYQLDVQYAVGRVAFDAAEDYARYAESVVAAERGAERGEARRPRKAQFFSVTHDGDRATRRCHDVLVEPLIRRFSQRAAQAEDRAGAWELATVSGGFATKAVLADLVGGGAPGLLFTSSHGMGFSPDDPRQSRHLGSLLCRDWPGAAAWRGPIPAEHYFSADDVGDSADVAGLIAVAFACFGAGSPSEDGYERHRSGRSRRRAARSLIARLPQRLLAHPRGGALAFVGHVDRAWTYAFDWPGAGENVQAFDSALQKLLAGYPVGAAMEYFGQRYAELSTLLSQTLDDIEYGAEADPRALFHLWTANNDARSYVVVGDPAVRLPGAAAATDAS